MRTSLILLAAAAVIAAPAFAKPPREESPAPLELLASVGGGNTDAELEAAIAAAAHPLGTAANPIRVAGPEGARSFLARLRCADGASARIGSQREGGVGAYGSVLRLYPIDCGSVAPGRVDLLLDIYHEEHVETRPPAGFRIGD
jgi:hypothetical protein